ncbi:alpha/beta fold hydrolase [Microbacterium oleivorans]|uniref:Alpha/beta hydrolase fold containing protein n=1 Tax=Microbacterium oleivorans TaxID=273677 RepID=A0A031FQ55_9MICO|nr:alpha/beta fold hydrolase [Microbacterium oleivorans]AZS44167.1 Putative aminoacrylate hydrolase RutD [Microbacterium oleivorans]EZP26989.1 Alpha/beta hydrolase fold containing protein [Microbacterium oleivorans]THE06048.1 alpha/beta fold hydrolase [Microbacterium oleivorans]
MTQIQRQVFDAEARAIPFIDEGEGPALVLIPAQGLDVAYLGGLASILEEEGFRIVRIGSRRSGGPAASMHDLAQDVVDVLDHLGVGSAWIGGHAFGGAVARTVALDHPGRASGVLLMGVEATRALSDDAARALRIAFSAPVDAPDTDAVRLLVGPGIDVALAWDVFARSRDLDVEELQSAALASTPVTEWATLASSLPILIIQGADDPITPPANGDDLKATAADRASVVRLPDAGHLFPMTHPGETAFQIEDYLGWD